MRRLERTEIVSAQIAVRALATPARYGMTREDARAAVNRYIDGDEERAAYVRHLLTQWSLPNGSLS